jgi:predicted RNase H-like nuclease (RuvC/YqgF family)
MKTKIHGLHMQLSKAKAELGRMTHRAADQDLSPQDQHDAQVAVPKLREQVADLSHAIHENEQVIEDIEKLIRHLELSHSRSARRTLCVRKLEAASDILRRELGDHPTD